MIKSSRYGNLLFDDQWGSFRKVFNLKYSRNPNVSGSPLYVAIFLSFLTLLIISLGIIWFVESIGTLETHPEKARMGIFASSLNIFMSLIILGLITTGEEFTSIRLYSGGIKHKRIRMRRNNEMMQYNSIINIEMIKNSDSSLDPKRKDYRTFCVEYKGNLPKVFYRTPSESKRNSPRQQYFDRMREQGFFKKKLYLHVKHHTQFINVLRSIFGENKWNDIYTDSTGDPQVAWTESGQDHDLGIVSKSLGDIYADEVAMKPEKIKRLMRNQKALFPAYITYISYWIYMYMYPVLTSNEFNTGDIETIVFLWALGLLAVSFFLVEILSLRWLSRSRIGYTLSGEPKLVLKYLSTDLMKTNPSVVMGMTLLTGVPFAFCIVWAFQIWAFPENATLFVIAIVFGTFTLLRNVFVERHYLITDQGIGYIKKSHWGLFTLFLPWGAFSGFTVRKNHIMLRHKEAGLRYSRLCPRRIPVFQNMNHARNIVGHYIPEQ